jgi:fucose 4-O-acetylase-like acetyltransferase
LQEAESQPRRDDIDRAKGLAILLVVFGHLVARAEPAGLTWYEPLRSAVYSFHMPFFMYLSGLVAAAPPPGGGARWLARRARRLLLPFLGVGLLILGGKLATSGWLPVDHAPDRLADGLRALFWRTADSPATSVWYLLVLFVYAAALPPLLRAAGGRLWLTVVLAVALFAWPAPPVAYLDRIAGYALFFAAGLVAARAACWPATIDRWRGWTLGAFALAVALVVAGLLPGGRLDAPAARAVLLGLGLLSMPALHGLVRAAPLAGSAALLALGRASFAIYLLNTILIGLAKALLLLVLPWDAAAFPLFASAMMLAGTLGPIVLLRGPTLRRGRPAAPSRGLEPG